MDIDEILEQLDLEFWAQDQGVRYKITHGHSGEQINFKDCPFCGNSKSKVYANVETGLGNCFRCDEPFNKLTFIHAHIGGTWKQTFDNVKETLKSQGYRPKRKTTAYVEMEDIKLPNSFSLPTLSGQNLVYLEKRGITGELSKYFHFRYCEEGWWNYTKPDGTSGGQKFDKRIIIPVFDLDGKIKTFQGRDITGTSDKKYLFPAGLPGTGAFLYNGQNAILAERIVLNEGVFDVAATKIALDGEIPLRDVVPVGSFGKHFSYGIRNNDDQLSRILSLKNRNLKQVTIMWDGEKDALTSAVKAGDIIKRAGLDVKIALLPKGKDPNEISAREVVAAFYNAQPLNSKNSVNWILRNPYS